MREVKVRFYLAGSFKNKELFREYREELVAMGHIVTSRWIEEEIPETDFNTARSHRAGIKDFQDIDMAWVVLLFTNPPSTTGGMHVEMGYAMARRRTVIVIGPYTNIFQRQARCQFDNWNEFKKRYPL